MNCSNFQIETGHTEIDEGIIAPLVVAYSAWLMNSGGTPPEDLLTKQLTSTQRKLLLERMNDVDVIYAITAPLRSANSEGSHTANCQR